MSSSSPAVDFFKAVRNAKIPHGRKKGFLTARELVKASGSSSDTVSRGLKALAEEGRLEVMIVDAVNIVGVHIKVPAYKIKKG
jgi:hypothetical protein